MEGTYEVFARWLAATSTGVAVDRTGRWVVTIRREEDGRLRMGGILLDPHSDHDAIILPTEGIGPDLGASPQGASVVGGALMLAGDHLLGSFGYRFEEGRAHVFGTVWIRGRREDLRRTPGPVLH